MPVPWEDGKVVEHPKLLPVALLPVPEEDDAVLDGGAGHGVDHAAADRHLGDGAGGERGEGEGESGECVAVSHQSWSPWLSSPKQQ